MGKKKSTKKKTASPKKEIDLKELLLSVKPKNCLLYIGIGFYFTTIGFAFVFFYIFKVMFKFSMNFVKSQNAKIDAEIKASKKKTKSI